MSSLLIKNARYLGDSVDLLVVDGKVQSLSASINAPTDAESWMPPEKSCSRALLMCIPTCASRYEWKETVATGLSSAAHGGFGAILCMANTDPVQRRRRGNGTESLSPPAARGPTVPASIPSGGHRRPQGEELTRMSELKDADASPSPTTDAQ